MSPQQCGTLKDEEYSRAGEHEVRFRAWVEFCTINETRMGQNGLQQLRAAHSGEVPQPNCRVRRRRQQVLRIGRPGQALHEALMSVQLNKYNLLQRPLINLPYTDFAMMG